MTTVGTIGVVLIGSLPLTELLQRALRKPFGVLGRKLGMNHVSMAGLLISLVNAIPVLTSMKDMDERGQVVNVAFSVCATSLLAAHLGFVTANAPEMLGAVLAAKAVGGIAAAAIAVRRACGYTSAPFVPEICQNRINCCSVSPIVDNLFYICALKPKNNNQN